MIEEKNKIENMSDHDLLIRVATQVEIILQGHTNHLEHHRKHDMTMLAVTLGSIFTALIAIGSAILALIR